MSPWGPPRAGTIPRAYLTFHIILRTYPMYVAISHVPLGAPFVPEPVIPNVALGAPCFCQDRRQYCLRATHRTYTESYVTTEKAGCGSKQASVLHRGTLRTAARAPFHGRSSRPCYPFHRAQGKWKKWGITECMLRFACPWTCNMIVNTCPGWHWHTPAFSPDARHLVQ